MVRQRQPCKRCGHPTAAVTGYCRSTEACEKLDARSRAIARYARDKEKINADCRAYYAANRERQRERARTWRQANPEMVKASTRRGHGKRTAFLTSLKVGKACLDCGLVCTADNYTAFDWDHRPGVIKLFGISQGLRYQRTHEEVLNEVAKCDLRCRNCHAIITTKRLREARNGD